MRRWRASSSPSRCQAKKRFRDSTALRVTGRATLLEARTPRTERELVDKASILAPFRLAPIVLPHQPTGRNAPSSTTTQVLPPLIAGARRLGWFSARDDRLFRLVLPSGPVVNGHYARASAEHE